MSEEIMPAEAGKPARTLAMVTEEIRYLDDQAKRLVLGHAIEIGRRLTEAKALVPYGGWGDYIEKELNYSQSTANNFMRIFDEYGAAQQSLFGPVAESQTLGKLSYTKALKLLAIPREEREAFAEEVDAEHLSTRELQQAIRERDEAIRERDKAVRDREYAEGKLREVSREADSHAELLSERDAAIQKKDSEICSLEKQVEELKARPVEVAVQEPDPAEVERRAGELAAQAKAEAEARAKADVEKAKADALRQTEAFRKRLDAAEKKLKEAEAKATDTGEAEAARAEIEALKKQLAMSDAATTTAKIYFTVWQEAFRKLREAVEAAPETARDKLRAAVRAQASAWAEEAGS